jgi:hypothetical protein
MLYLLSELNDCSDALQMMQVATENAIQIPQLFAE